MDEEPLPAVLREIKRLDGDFFPAILDRGGWKDWMWSSLEISIELVKERFQMEEYAIYDGGKDEKA